MSMQPKVHDVTVRLPVTFNYSKPSKNTTFATVVSTLVCVLLTVLISVLIFKSKKVLLLKIILEIIVLVAMTFILRFFIWKENLYKDAFENLEECNFCPSVNSFWNIYDVEREYPYIAHFKGGNGEKGIFVRFEKGIISGLTDELIYNHYDAISEAYNLVGKSNINMTHIDYMDNLGNDDRLATLNGQLQNCPYEELRDVVSCIYGNLQQKMILEYTSYDVYCFRSNLKNDVFWFNVLDIIEQMTSSGKSNFVAYTVLDLDGIRKIAPALLNLEEFSAIEACNSTYNSVGVSKIKPIELVKASGEVEKLGDTDEEIREKQENKKVVVDTSKKDISIVNNSAQSSNGQLEDFDDLF